MTSRVYVTGVGVVSSLGLGRGAFWSSLLAGRSGVAPVTAFDATKLDRTLAAEVRDFRASDHVTARELRDGGRCSHMSLAAARMAVADAALPADALRTERAAVVFGTTMGDADLLSSLDDAFILQGRDAVSPAVVGRYSPSAHQMHVARAFGCRGAVLSLPAACAAGNYAIAMAADLLRAGRADVAVCGSAEMLQELEFCGFLRLGALAPERPQPFDANRAGLILGEGAGVFVLETEAHAVRRGANVLAEVGGYGVACDGFHITRPLPDAGGITRAMREAITRSGLDPADVDFVNAHGTATKANDAAESLAMKQVFEGRRVPISSIKSMLGHTMGASSALEAASCVETILTGLYPPTIHYETPDPECDVDLVANAPRAGRADVVLNNALAFGGYDAVLCLAKPGRLPSPAELEA
jgi:3-oxoacyl-[acyl-carrier-protein] synthase II